MLYTNAHPVMRDEIALFTDSAIQNGAIVADVSSLPAIEKNNKYAITACGVYLDTQKTDYQFINHSCDPNMQFDQTRRQFIACKNITPHEMLTFNYTLTEPSLASPFKCECGASCCKKMII